MEVIKPGSIWRLGIREICVWDCVVKNKDKLEIEFMTDQGNVIIRDFDPEVWQEQAKFIGSVQ